jgi:hypothetical protein
LSRSSPATASSSHLHLSTSATASLSSRLALLCIITMLVALLAGTLPLAAAVPTEVLRQRAAPNVLFSLFFDKATKASSVLVTDEAKTTIYGHACSDSLSLGSVNVAFAGIDDFGGGKLSIGANTYDIHQDALVSGGIECGVVYDDSTMIIDCVAPWTAGPLPRALPANATQPCFADHMDGRASYGLDSGSSEPFAVRDLSQVEAARQQRRQTTFCSVYPNYELVNDGNPHQNYQYTQISVRPPPLPPITMNGL